MRVLNKTDLIEILRELQRRLGDDVEPHLIFLVNDPRWIGSDVFPCDDGGIPALVPGTHGGCRISSPDGPDGPHLERHGDRFEIHLDRIDARRAPLAHLADATHVKDGLGWGAVVGAGLALLTKRPEFLLAGPGLGGAIGAMTPRRTNRYFALQPDNSLWEIPAGRREQWLAFLPPHFA